MSRAPFQVLVFPFRKVSETEVLYAVFKRNASTGGFWQGIAGGGENDESPLEAAKRETFEEANLGQSNRFIQLDSQATIPVVNVCGFKWGNNVLVIPEYCFGVETESSEIQLSNEHTTYEWLRYEEARELLQWDSNKTALWELNHRLINQLL